MDERLALLLDELHERGRAFDRHEPDRLKRWRNVEPDTAKAMSLLIRALAPLRILELGTSNGYSTIWLAEAARTVDGRVTSVEIDPDRSAQAHENLLRARLASHVELRVQDASEALAQSEDRSWDFIFLDAERAAYPAYWPQLRRVLAPRGMLVVDNVISHADELLGFRGVLAEDEGMAEALMPTGAGALLVVHEPRPDSSHGPHLRLPRLFHITRAADWEEAQKSGTYRVSTLDRGLEEEGFIHLSFAHQVKPVADAFYRGMQGLLLLQIDPARLHSKLSVEDLLETGEKFPHLYGALNMDAVEHVHHFTPAPDGTFAAMEEGTGWT